MCRVRETLRRSYWIVSLYGGMTAAVVFVGLRGGDWRDLVCVSCGWFFIHVHIMCAGEMEVSLKIRILADQLV